MFSQRCVLYECVLVIDAVYDMKNRVDPQIFFLPGSTETGVRVKIDVKALCKLSVQFSSVTQLCPTLCNPVDCSTPGLPVHHQLSEFTQTHVHWVSDAIQPSPPLSSPSPPTFNLSQHQGLFKWVSSLTRWPKYWSFSFSISPPNEYSGLISFRMDWLDLLVVQGPLKSFLQYHSSRMLFFKKWFELHSESPS